jgi:hypothetical protein
VTGDIGLLDTVECATSEFTIGRSESGDRFILHHTCRKRSYNSMDIQHRYCAFCKVFLEDTGQ